MNQAKVERPLVVVNGLGAPHFVVQAYGAYFRHHGRKVFVAPQKCLYYGDIRDSAAMVAGTVEEALHETRADRVDLVGMSLGGIIGYYYVACLGGAETIASFVSVGGPVNGCPIAYLGLLPPLVFTKAIKQCRPNSEIFREIHAAPDPSNVRLYSIGTKGDAITSRRCWDAPGFEVITSPHGVFPVGHWMLFAHPGNLKLVRGLLDR